MALVFTLLPFNPTVLAVAATEAADEGDMSLVGEAVGDSQRIGLALPADIDAVDTADESETSLVGEGLAPPAFLAFNIQQKHP
ncbi:MAG: hypothetical protein LBI54_01780 [Lachnospiraceae bacterium]|jgi:hypothetical protein|nr:hypothetical protein [Lachnospiraceae bacterium]